MAVTKARPPKQKSPEQWHTRAGELPPYRVVQLLQEVQLATRRWIVRVPPALAAPAAPTALLLLRFQGVDELVCLSSGGGALAPVTQHLLAGR